jgi:hypothetical protein
MSGMSREEISKIWLDTKGVQRPLAMPGVEFRISIETSDGEVHGSWSQTPHEAFNSTLDKFGLRQFMELAKSGKHIRAKAGVKGASE